MRVPVALTVPELASAAVVRVAEVDRNVLRSTPSRTSDSAAPMATVTALDFGALARCTTACARFRLHLGQPDELDGAGGRVGHEQGGVVGGADVLAGEDDRAVER